MNTKRVSLQPPNLINLVDMSAIWKNGNSNLNGISLQQISIVKHIYSSDRIDDSFKP